MNQFQEGADAIRKLAVTFKAIVAVADGLDRIGSFENAEEESQARIEASRKAESEAKADLERAIYALNQARAEAQTVVDNAHLERERLTGEVNVRVAAVLREASEKADNDLAESQRQIDEDRSAMVRELNAGRLEAKQLAEEKAALEASVIDARAQLVEINGAIDTARNTMAQFVRG